MADNDDNSPRVADTWVPGPAQSGASPPPLSPLPASREATPAPRPASGSRGTVGTTLPIEDLLNDKLLLEAPRGKFEGKVVPVLGGIPLLARLGRGGMGVVYYGVQTRLRADVAVKVLPMGMLSQHPDLKERLYREGRMAARIKSPYLVSVVDVNEDAGLFYLLMEFVNGMTAGAHLRALRAGGGTGLPESVALEVCLAAARGLAAAHEESIIHRDIKPENILIPRNKSGELNFAAAKLADLGLARSDELEQSLTGAETAMGTPGYMAPEQAMDAKEAGKPADVFGLGATLYALLAGRAPWTGETPFTVVYNTLNQPHPPIQQARPEVSPACAQIIDRCLCKEPDGRYPDGAELARAIEACRAAARVEADRQAGEERQARDAKTQEVLASALRFAQQARARREWGLAVAALEALPNDSAPGTPSSDPDRRAAAELLAEARKEQQRRGEMAAGFRKVAGMLSNGAFTEAQGVFSDALKFWGSDTQILAPAAAPAVPVVPASAPAVPMVGPASVPAIVPASSRQDAGPAASAGGDSGPAQPTPTPAPSVAQSQSAIAAPATPAAPAPAGPEAGPVNRQDARVTATVPPPPPRELILDLSAGVKLELILVPAGKFTMGSPPGEEGRGRDEGPQHEVAISRDFYMSKYEITQPQYEQIMRHNPSRFTDRNGPVECVTWFDALEFCEKLSRKKNRAVRLPTEAEWEYACRAGNSTAFAFGNTIHTDFANYDGTCIYGDGRKGGNLRKPVWVGSFAPNKFGLHDMHGNVWEWCQDWYSEQAYTAEPASDPQGPAEGRLRVLRGGSWEDMPGFCRCANRAGYVPESRNANIGFRIAAGVEKV